MDICTVPKTVYMYGLIIPNRNYLVPNKPAFMALNGRHR